MGTRTRLFMQFALIFALLLIFHAPLIAQSNIKEGDRKNAQPTQIIEKEQKVKSEHTPLSEDQILQAIDQALKQGDNDIASQYMCYLLGNISEEPVKTQKIADKIMAIPEYEAFNKEYPEYAHEVEIAKLRTLGYFGDYAGVKDYVINSLNLDIPGIQVTAARILLSWGEWDMAAPIICKYEAYDAFQRYNDDRAVPLLEKAINSGSWQGRIFAAAALFYSYGDSAAYPQVALDILMNAPINTTDEDINRAKFMALQQVPKFNLTEALPGLIRLSQDTARGIGATAVGYIVDLGAMGNQVAIQALSEIKINNPNADIREIANYGLNKISQDKK